MAITFPIAGVTSTIVSSRSPSVTFGSAPQKNDLIVMFIASTTTAVVVDVSGWVNVISANLDVESDSHQSSMYYHLVTEAEANANQTTFTITNLFTTTETGRVSAMVMRGVDITAPVSNANSTFSSANAATPWVIPGFTPFYSDSVFIGGVSGDGAATQTTPSGWTLRAGAGTTQSCYLYTRDALTVSGTPIANTNVTPSVGDEYIGISAEIRAARVPDACFNTFSTLGPGSNEVTLTWGHVTDNGSPVTDFIIEYSQSISGSWGSWVQYSDGVSTNQSAVVALTENNVYRFRVSAVNIAGTGPSAQFTPEMNLPNPEQLSSDERNFTGSAGSWTGGTVSAGTYTKTEPNAATQIKFETGFIPATPGDNAAGRINVQFFSTLTPSFALVAYNSSFVQVGASGPGVGIYPYYYDAIYNNLPATTAYVTLRITATTNDVNDVLTISNASLRTTSPPASVINNMIVGMNACIV